MGLAASQAKLLFITQRQNDVSAKMQRISNDTMILARDDEEISAKYSKMLYATKRVLKGDDAFIYDNLMGATAAQNDYYQGILNAANKVVLDSSLRSALEPLSKIGDVGTGAEFLNAYPTVKDFQKVIAPTTLGLNSGLSNKVLGFVSEFGTYPTTQNMSMRELISKVSGQWSDYMNDACGARKAHTSGTSFSTNIGGKSFFDIANASQDFVTELANDNGAGGTPFEAAKSNFKNIGNMIITALGNAMGISNVEGSLYQQTMKSYVDTLANSIDFDDHNKTGNHNDAVNGGVRDARNSLVGNATGENSGKSAKDTDIFTLNVSEYIRKLAQKAMSVCSEDGIMEEPGSKVTDPSSASKNLMNKKTDVSVNEKGYSKSEYEKKLKERFPDGSDYNKVVQYLSRIAPDVEVSDYYQNMYDNLKTNGWSFEDIADIKAKLNDVTSGYSLSSDNASKANDDLYVEVPDEETRKQASAWYESEMSKINRKEKKLQTDLTKLQNEYSALTNDMNSVQSIIQGNIQRSFTFCQSG